MTLPGGPVGAPLTEQRREGGADQQRAALAEHAVGDGEADDRVDGPRVQRPVEQRGGHGVLQRPAGCPLRRCRAAASRSATAARRRRRTSGRCPCPRRTSSRSTRRCGTPAPRRRGPSGMRPNLPAASQITNSTKPLATRENSQPMLCTTQPRPAVEAELSVEVLRKPQSTKPMAMAAVTPKTIVSRLLRLLCRVLLEREVEGGVQGLLEGACLPRRIDGRGGSGVGQLCAHAVTAPRVAGRLSFVFSSVTYQARTVDGPPCRQRGQRPNRTARRNASARLVPLWHNEVHVCRESHHTGAGSGVRSRVAAAAWGRAASPWRPSRAGRGRPADRAAPRSRGGRWCRPRAAGSRRGR